MSKERTKIIRAYSLADAITTVLSVCLIFNLWQWLPINVDRHTEFFVGLGVWLLSEFHGAMRAYFTLQSPSITINASKESDNV